MTQPTRLARAILAWFGLAIGHVPSTAAAEPLERIAVTAVKPLLILAVEQGEAHGVLNGPAADYVQRRFEVATPIEIDVRRLHRLAQPGCGRLEVTTHQRAVLENGARHDQALTYQVSFCSDGRFPVKR